MSTRGQINVLELRSVWGTGGGPEKTILLGTARADRERYHVTVCYVRDSRDEVFGIDRRAGALDIDYIEIRERHSLDSSIWRSLTQLISDRRIDIVHAHEYKTDALALLLGKRRGVIPLATVHGWTGDSARERYLYYPIDRWMLARFPMAIAVSSDIKTQLVQRGADPEKVIVVLNAIDGDAFRRDRAREPAIRAALGFEPGTTIVGAIGRVERQKRFDVLLDAMAPLLIERPSMHLVIVGDGSLRAPLAAQTARLGLVRQVHWLGHRTDIADLHHAFDLYVQSSEYEGTPNSVLEAMAMQTPLVATDVGGTREIAIPDVHGLIVPPHDVAALRAGVVTALSAPLAARQRADGARARIETDLSFEARTRKLERVYDELIAMRDGRLLRAGSGQARA